MRSIAIPVADRAECRIALDVAFRLAKHLGASVQGYHLRPGNKPPKAAGLAFAALWGDEAWPGDESGKTGKAGAAAARDLFAAKAAGHSFRLAKKTTGSVALHAAWQEKLGTPEHLMPVIGALNDLLVVSRPRRDGGRKCWLVMMAALLSSGIPVLLLPQTKASVPCKHIAIGWNRGPQEALAVHAALPLLQAAERVTLLSGGSKHKSGASARAMSGYLACHGIAASELKCAGESGFDLVKAAKGAGADVLLCGAYTKGRRRQLFFGGVTEHLVNGTSFPVILMHS